LNAHEEEGVIKFRAEHREQALDARTYGELATTLNGWRRALSLLHVVGRDPARYGGAGYGNLSARVGPPSNGKGHRAMLITGSQTGHIEKLTLQHYTVVTRYDLKTGVVESHGLVLPSSETMTHGAIYDLSPHIRFVFHAHAPAVWQRRKELRIPTTEPDVGYGTPEMAYSVQSLYRSTGLAESRLLAMGGHEDGVIAFGKTADEAGQILVTALAAAFQLED
jgi:ribulose-5-phosphate 4-epimerase/fuculose-1-phosphate aldolase